MGVKACFRSRCENTMCDHYSEAYGYICNECLSELQGKVGEVTIEEFMASPKPRPGENEIATEESITRAFGLNQDD